MADVAISALCGPLVVAGLRRSKIGQKRELSFTGKGTHVKHGTHGNLETDFRPSTYFGPAVFRFSCSSLLHCSLVSLVPLVYVSQTKTLFLGFSLQDLLFVEQAAHRVA